MTQPSQLLDQIRDDLAADLEAARSLSAADWIRAGVDATLSAGLFCRTAIHSCVYAVNYGEPGAEISMSLWDCPLDAESWTPWDSVQASSVSLAIVIWLASQASTIRTDPALAVAVASQASVLAIDPLVAAKEVMAG